MTDRDMTNQEAARAFVAGALSGYEEMAVLARDIQGVLTAEQVDALVRLLSRGETGSERPRD